jgi:hypothetical protein
LFVFFFVLGQLFFLARAFQAVVAEPVLIERYTGEGIRKNALIAQFQL